MNLIKKKLAIGIPTYKRPKKLIRLLEILKHEIFRCQIQHQIQIIISDNSEDSFTENVMSEFDSAGLDLSYFKQPTNIGADKNYYYLYEKCLAEYIWFISDDDIPLQESISKILQALVSAVPDVLLFSFIQPPGSPIRQFNYGNELEILTENIKIVESILTYPKISIYVIKKVEFSQSQIDLLLSVSGHGWLFLYISLHVIQNSNLPRVAIYSEALASSDAEYNHIWVPDPFLHWYKISMHPFIQKNYPAIEKKMRTQGYLQCILFSWALKKGTHSLDDKKGLDLFIKNLKWDYKILIVRPKIFLRFLLLKLNLVSLFNRM
ncbi:MAG: glycosyltransferase [Chitinophagia bacterium]|jgi:glycosyltransferase involved in cell wall biosynthesis